MKLRAENCVAFIFRNAAGILQLSISRIDWTGYIHLIYSFRISTWFRHLRRRIQMQTGHVFGRTLLVMVFAVVCSFLSSSDVLAAQAGCETQCVKQDNVCVQEAEECVQSEQVCTQTKSECIQTKRECSLYNMKTGACVQYENRCVSRADKCVQKQNVCKKKQRTCKKYQQRCVKEQQVCKSTAPATSQSNSTQKPPSSKVQPNQSCAACNANRTNCHNACDRNNDLVQRLRCVDSCNAKFQCIIGRDCR